MVANGMTRVAAETEPPRDALAGALPDQGDRRGPRRRVSRFASGGTSTVWVRTPADY